MLWFYNPAYLPSNPNPVLFQLAENLRSHKSFADGFYPDLKPHSAYAPLYPLLIAPLTVFPVLIAILQWALAAATGIIIYWLALRLEIRPGAALTGGILFSLEPYYTLLRNGIHAEILFTFLIALAVFLFFHSLEHPNKTLYIAGLGFTIALAALTRPVGLPLILLIPYAAFLNRSSWSSWKNIALGLAVFILAVLPWSVRNKLVFDSWSLSSLHAHQFIHAHLPHYLEWKEKGRSSSEENIVARLNDLRDAASHMTNSDLHGRMINLTESKIVMKELVNPVLKKEYGNMIIFYFSQFPFLMMTDNWRMGFNIVTQIPPGTETSLSAALTATRGDFRELTKTLYSSFDIYTFLFVSGKLFWLSVYALACAGFYRLWRINGRSRPILLAFVFIIFTLPFLSLPYLESRYRLPVMPYVFVLASAGMASLKTRAPRKLFDKAQSVFFRSRPS